MAPAQLSATVLLCNQPCLHYNLDDFEIDPWTFGINGKEGVTRKSNLDSADVSLAVSIFFDRV